MFLLAAGMRRNHSEAQVLEPVSKREDPHAPAALLHRTREAALKLTRTTADR
jgi:hypothetical protein